MPTDRRAIQLQPVLDIAGVQALHAVLTEALDTGYPIQLDAQQVERADACGLQLLYALVTAAAANGVACRWDNVSDALRGSAALCGMQERLGLA